MTLSSTDLDIIVRTALAAIAPEIDADRVPANANVRDSLDLDSVDFLNFVEAMHAATGVDIPERDYRAVETIAGCVTYLLGRLAYRPRTEGA